MMYPPDPELNLLYRILSPVLVPRSALLCFCEGGTDKFRNPKTDVLRSIRRVAFLVSG